MVEVIWNEDRLEIYEFQDFVDLFFLDTEWKGKIAYSRIVKYDGECWKVGVAVSNGYFKHVSCVNSIATLRGGAHVNHVTDTIIDKRMRKRKQIKNGITTIAQSGVRKQLWVFINYLIDEPEFEDSEKFELQKLDSSKKFVPTGAFIDQLVEMGIFDRLERIDEKNLANRTNQFLNIVNLQVANHAGSENS